MKKKCYVTVLNFDYSFHFKDFFSSVAYTSMTLRSSNVECHEGIRKDIFVCLPFHSYLSVKKAPNVLNWLDCTGNKMEYIFFFSFHMLTRGGFSYLRDNHFLLANKKKIDLIEKFPFFCLHPTSDEIIWDRLMSVWVIKEGELSWGGEMDELG